jgi:tetratricopeptide (TPR) repeat protein
LAFVLLLTLLAYLPALKGSQLWDDDAHITVPELQSFAGLSHIWFRMGATQQYYPLLHSAFWLEHRLWGDSVLGYHLVNVLWHLLAVTLIYIILTRLKIRGALLAAAIFGVHPVMVESVAWITEQKNTLSAVFYLSAMLAYLNFDQSRRPAHYFLAIGLFALGLLTKTVTASLPAALLVIFWWQRGTLSGRRDVRPLVPFFALGAAAGLLTAWVERTQLGAHGADFDLSFLDRCVLAGRVIWFYVGKLFWPTNLTFIYPRWTIDPAQAWQWTFSLGAAALTIALWAVRTRWRAPLAGWLYFCGTLFPALGFINVYPFLFSFVADHFQYLASLGIIVPTASAVAIMLARLPQRAYTAGVIISIVLISTLGLLTRKQSALYADGISLYQATLDRNPDCWMAHNNLGVKVAALGDQSNAIAHYRTALQLKPDYFEAHNNLGDAYVRLGQLPEAIKEFQTALALKPDFFNALNNLGLTLTNSGRDAEAVETLQAALALNPDHPITLNNLGLALIHLGRHREAIEQIGNALQLKPDYADGHNALGIALASSGQMPAAIEHFEAAIALNRNFLEAYNNLARALATANRLDEAIETTERSINVARAMGNEAAARRIEESRQQLQKNRP